MTAKFEERCRIVFCQTDFQSLIPLFLLYESDETKTRMENMDTIVQTDRLTGGVTTHVEVTSLVCFYSRTWCFFLLLPLTQTHYAIFCCSFHSRCPPAWCDPLCL